MDSQKKYKGIILFLISIILILVVLIIMIAFGKINFNFSNKNKDNEVINNNLDNKDEVIDDNLENKDEVIDDNLENNPEINDNDSPKFDYTKLPVEYGYTEISLTNEEKKQINKTLFDEFRPGSDVGFLTSYYDDDEDDTNDFNDINVAYDMFKSDCTKLSFARWYISFNNNANYKFDTKVSGNECGKIKYSRLKEITQDMFNVTGLYCDDELFIKSIDEDGYADLVCGGGGYGPVAIKVLAKYQNNNNYYLLIHTYNGFDGMKGTLNDYVDDHDAKVNSDYIKLKYGIRDDNSKYIISFEYLN